MDAVISSFLTSFPDVQRGETWEADESLVRELGESVEKRGKNLVLLNDCFEPGLRGGIEYVSARPLCQPYFGRWQAQLKYLSENPRIKRAFFVDSTDVVMQYDPFYEMEEGKVYTGDERDVLGSEWMREDGFFPPVSGFIEENPDMLTLNCGVLGGSSGDLKEICRMILDCWAHSGKLARTEMSIYNMVMRKNFNDRIVRGGAVTSNFKSYETGSSAWFKHK